MAGRKRAEMTATGLSAELALRLRALRDESRLTLRQLAAKSGFSPSALSLAESGRAVPSWDLVAAFVQSCGQDPARWRQLWEVAQEHSAQSLIEPDAIADQDEPVTPQPARSTRPAAPPQPADAEDEGEVVGTAQPIPEDPAATDQTPDRPSAPALRSPLRRPALLAIAGTIAAAVAVGAILLMVRTSPPAGTGASANANATKQPTAPARSPLAAAPVVTAAKDGTDPYDDHCKADEKELDWQPVFRPDHSAFGTILLMYSPACQAAWGYLDGPNTTAWTSHIVAHRVPGDATAPSQFGGDAAYGSWGNVLSTRTGCVYIESYVVGSPGEGPHAKTACIQPVPPATP